MEKIKSFISRSWPIIIVLITIMTVYLLTLPKTVQHGDTGELVVNSHFFRLSHPPGYPLFHLLTGFFSNLIKFNTVFWRASLTQMLFSLLSIFIILYNYPQRKILCGLLVLMLAFSEIFWKYSILPDVFALNNLFVILIITFYLNRTPRLDLLTVFFFCIGLTNHHTLIFLSPIIIHIIYLNKKSPKILLTLLFGILFFIGLYFSLFLFDTSNNTSWGKLTDFKGLFYHLIRHDYGTFQLTSLKDENVFIKIVYEYFIDLILNFWPFIILLLFFLVNIFKKNRPIRNEYFFLVFILLSYIYIFFNNANISPYGYKYLVLSRFFILPHLIILLLLIDLLSKSHFSTNQAQILFASFFICFISNFYFNFSKNNYAYNSILEEYHTRVLLDMKPNSILFAQGDVSLFNFYYIQEINNYRKDIKIISPVLINYPWYRQKKGLNSFPFSSYNSSYVINRLQDFYKSPVYIVPYYLKSLKTDFPKNKYNFHGVNIEISQNTEDQFNCKTLSQYGLKTIISEQDYRPEYSLSVQFFLNYGDCFFNHALMKTQAGQYNEALLNIKEVLNIAPYHLPAIFLKCEVMKKLGNLKEYYSCMDIINTKLEQSYDYYDFSDWLKKIKKVK